MPHQPASAAKGTAARATTATKRNSLAGLIHCILFLLNYDTWLRENYMYLTEGSLSSFFPTVSLGLVLECLNG
jgi:hypothetical protein